MKPETYQAVGAISGAAALIVTGFLANRQAKIASQAASEQAKRSAQDTAESVLRSDLLRSSEQAWDLWRQALADLRKANARIADLEKRNDLLEEEIRILRAGPSTMPGDNTKGSKDDGI